MLSIVVDLLSLCCRNVIATHPYNGINFVALWIKGKNLMRRIVAEVRIDGYPIDVLYIDTPRNLMKTVTVKKYDSGKKPIWLVADISDMTDIRRLCTIMERVISWKPPGRRVL